LVRAVSTSLRCAVTAGCGYKPMLARLRSTAVMVAVVMVSRSSSSWAGLAGPDEVLCSEECGVLSWRLAIRAGKEDVSLSVVCTAWEIQEILCIPSVEDLPPHLGCGWKNRCPKFPKWLPVCCIFGCSKGPLVGVVASCLLNDHWQSLSMTLGSRFAQCVPYPTGGVSIGGCCLKRFMQGENVTIQVGCEGRVILGGLGEGKTKSVTSGRWRPFRK